jgi:hypothetical protein
MSTKFSLPQLTKRVRVSIAEHNGALPKEQALIWFGHFVALLELQIIETDAFESLMALLPNYPNDPVVHRMLGRSFHGDGA